ncbi:hypothetical protein E3P92_01132 [Wallemia ichthyophaga]|uniref:Uncharacterized protein n=2 Tax=Wallemia ichthyophaga TaxID=245174 RepID=A0A4T0HJT3_WALIC|nr:uncharacterized protein J056_002030 [Wallemia ichthyophaga EXF-994]TIA74665.1 hypothetical protein E3P91_00839 [Wallemia ichthyophaga]EOR03952.1 hypothetical protein J056_002030 [Wallemia ichthyophaga EXF-994]TIA83076.1 hypothetical protein E3P98_00985 [Wallemia ichthyophaga]TIA92079.1 hypothetical protein E3P97_01673 [Wallemia ichthyophaga]TIA94854.1 hypothetical protein E3P96_04001 [Wallemia ichthyophaga]
MVHNPSQSSVSSSASGAISQRTNQTVSDPGVSNVDCYWSCDICGLMCKAQHEFCDDAFCSGKRPARNSRRWFI